MLRTEEHKKREEERSRAERRRKREDFLRSRGVSNANLSLLPDDLDDPTPSPIARDLERYDQARVAAEEHARREAAREAFQGTWLRSTEKDLKRCCERYQASDDSSERSMLKAYIKQLSGKLRFLWECLELPRLWRNGGGRAHFSAFWTSANSTWSRV